MNKNKNLFGNALQKYWDRRYNLFSRFDEGIQIDEEGLYSATPEIIALRQAEKMNCKVVVDGFCGVGANAIAFARFGTKVYAIEKDEKRLEMARHNAKIYGVVDKIKFIHGDFFIEAPKIKAEGTCPEPGEWVFLDPSWGGPKHENLRSFKLSDFLPDGNDILKLAFSNFPKIALKVPDNFDISELEKLGKAYEIEDDIMYGRVIFRTVYFS
jgi:trimethylguanosine synthase